MSPEINRFAFVATIALALAGSACSGMLGDNAETVEPETERVALEDFAASYAKSMCGALFDCCRASERNTLSSQYYGVDLSSEESCESTMEGLLYQSYITPVRKARNDGRVGWDARSAGSCVSELESISCSNFNGLPQPSTRCSQNTVPKVSVGGTCKRSFDCKTGHCVRSDADASRGTCRRYAGRGDSCSNRYCGEGLYCDVDSNVCKRKKSNGSTCLIDGDCASGVCSEVSAGTYVCQPKRSGGASCEYDSECKSGVCNIPRGSDTGTCLGTPVCSGS